MPRPARPAPGHAARRTPAAGTPPLASNQAGPSRPTWPGRARTPGSTVRAGPGPRSNATAGAAQPAAPPADGSGRPAERGALNTPSQPGYVPGGFRQNDDVRDYEQVRRDRREYSEGGRTFYREPGRIIVRDRDGYLIRHDENERFRDLDPRGYRYERRGADYYNFIDRPGGRADRHRHG
ncbi:hypothetical protein ACU4GR_23390 [Methylobacterium oryzae CBMB20]